MFRRKLVDFNDRPEKVKTVSGYRFVRPKFFEVLENGVKNSQVGNFLKKKREIVDDIRNNPNKRKTIEFIFGVEKVEK